MARKRRHIELPLEIKILILNKLILEIRATKRELAKMCLVWRDAAPIIRAYVFNELILRKPTGAKNTLLVDASHIAPFVLSANFDPSALRRLHTLKFPQLLSIFVNLTTLICSHFKDKDINTSFCTALSLLAISTLTVKSCTITKHVQLIAAVSAHLKALHIERSTFKMRMPYIGERWNWRNPLVLKRDATSELPPYAVSLDLETLHFSRSSRLIHEFFSDDTFSPVRDVHTLSTDMISDRTVDITQKLMARFSSLKTLEISRVGCDVVTLLDISQVKHLRFDIHLVTLQGGCTVLWGWYIDTLERLPLHSSLRSLQIQLIVQYNDPLCDVAHPRATLWRSLDRVLCAENLAYLEKLTFYVVYPEPMQNKDGEQLKEKIKHWLLARCLPLTCNKYFLAFPPKGSVTFHDNRPAPIV